MADVVLLITGSHTYARDRAALEWARLTILAAITDALRACAGGCGEVPQGRACYLCDECGAVLCTRCRRRIARRDLCPRCRPGKGERRG